LFERFGRVKTVNRVEQSFTPVSSSEIALSRLNFVSDSKLSRRKQLNRNSVNSKVLSIEKLALSI